MNGSEGQVTGPGIQPGPVSFEDDWRGGAGVTASLLGSIAAGAVVVGAAHAAQHRRRMLWCGLGAVLSIAGLTALVVTLDYHGTPVATAVAALAIVAAGPLVWYGSTQAQETPGPARLDATGSSGYPLLALPLVGSALATGYQLVQHRSLDVVAIGLALAGIVLIVARELLASAALRRYADHLAAQGEQLRALVLGAGEIALILDGRLVVRWQSPAAARQFGLSDQDVVGQPATALVHPDDAGRCAAYLARSADAAPEPCEVRLRDGFGAWRDTEWRLNGPDPARPGWSLVVHVRDISQRRELERTLRRSAYADRLTSLANRQGLRRAGEVVGEVVGSGRIEDPLAGRRRPAASAVCGRGLWMVNQLCDLVELRSGPSRTTLRMHMRCA